jgi:O-glycosyl hydrolase
VFLISVTVVMFMVHVTKSYILLNMQLFSQVGYTQLWCHSLEDYMSKIYVCVFIGVNARMYLSISKKKIPQIYYKGFPGLLAYVSTVVCVIIHNSNKKNLISY